MMEIYAAYYRIRLWWAIAWRWLAFGALVAGVLWLGGCASTPQSPEYLKAKADCDAAAAPAHGLQVAIVYRDCMHARGFK